ncbi:GGDEF domain-containing protein [[Clostridium] polysaccharolyticum]|uniref:Diguanylate cyclase (GGDEF) domain-containing protein n=1 Tax=[Clostridium] polysaccharolyticum TaxID=29364 RepID=A0A1I0CSD8_9FIRM|nr:GGDEF domain-containing protein [[Clostridium] polysaccharolyticum]SET22689.1 diguanylate cyclase (GGDEF) domain-containing protein [[Clostridium] polysaccharolyticum]
MLKKLKLHQLVVIVIIAIICDNIGCKVFGENLIAGQVLQFIGGMALPMILYILAESFMQTNNERNFILQVFGTWILSIYPYDMFMGAEFARKQNLLYDILLASVVLVIEKARKEERLKLIIAIILHFLLCLIAMKSSRNSIIPLLYIFLYYGKMNGYRKDKKEKIDFTFWQVILVMGNFLFRVAIDLKYHNNWVCNWYLLGNLLAIPIIYFYEKNHILIRDKLQSILYSYPFIFIGLCIVFHCPCYDYNEYYLTLSTITTIMLIVFGCMSLTNRTSKAQLANIMLIITSIFFMSGLYLQLTTGDIRVVYLSQKIQYCGIIGMLISFTKLIDAFYYAKFPKWLYYLEYTISTLVILSLFSVEQNNFFYRSLVLRKTEGIVCVFETPGILCIIFYLYVAFLFLYIAYFCIKKIKSCEKNDRIQCINILAGASMPSICMFIKATGLTRGYDLMTFGILGVIFFFSLALVKDDSLDRILTEAEKDPLTGVSNRGFFIDVVSGWLQKRKKGSLVMLDLDDFKDVNDNFGHGVGDKVLSTLGESITQVIAQTNFTARFGGDEFCIFLINQVSKKEIAVIMEQLNEAFQNNIRFLKLDIKTDLSIGIAVNNGKTRISFEELYENADKALYLAKNSGKGQYKFYK